MDNKKLTGNINIMGKTIYERVVEKIANIPDREGLPKNEYEKALGISKKTKVEVHKINLSVCRRQTDSK